MARKALSAFLIAAAFLGGAAFAQTVAPLPRGPVVAADPVRIRSLQDDVSQLKARVAALEAAMAQAASRVTALNQKVAPLEHHRHLFTDNSVSWQNVTVAGKQASHITDEVAAHDITNGPTP
jgi:hypothetical protein